MEFLAMLLILFFIGDSKGKKKPPKHWNHKRTEEEAQAEKERVLRYLKS